MYVDEKKAQHKAAKAGTTYYFCSRNCLEEFLKPEKEFRKMKFLTIFSISIGILVLYIDHFTNISDKHLILFILATPVQFIAGWRFYLGTLDAIKARQANMDSLIAIGTSAAWLYSTLVTFFPFFPSEGVYFTESSLIIGFILLGKTMEHIVKGKASEALRKLIDLQPKTAMVIRNNKEIEIPVEKIKKNDIVLIKVGERIPVDGIIIEGHSSLDQSAVTGESIPIEKEKGDEVISASINKSGVLKIRATKVGSDTTIAQIVKMVEEAMVSRAPIQRMADKVASFFVPLVIFIAIGSFIFWYFIANISFAVAFTILISVLIIACPCALGIATPAAILVGATKGAQSGVLIKSGEYLEKAHKLQAIVFDKTGTLTHGKPVVTDVIVLKWNESSIIRFAAIAEKRSEHPLAAAILEEAEKKGLRIDEPKKFSVISGKGVKAVHGKNVIVFGNRKLMNDNKIAIDEYEEKITALENEGKTVMLLAVNGKLIGVIAVADTLKDEARYAIKKLQKMGIETIMLTGDNERTAKAIAEKLGIEQVIANVLPQDKAKIIKGLQQEGKIVAMVGDGINDAPALAQADVGIAIGSGTDIAKETGGIILVKNKVTDVVNAIDLSKHTVRKIKQNLFWAFFYNIALIPVAAGLLLPLGILLNPILAAIAMATSSITVVGNSMLLSKYRPPILN